MKIEKEMKLSGYFWLPDNDKKKIPGTLYIGENGDIKLEILGRLSDSEDFEKEIPLICGNVEEKNYITLEDSFYTSQSFNAISKSKIVSNYAYMGIPFSNTEDIQFDTYIFELDGFGEWLSQYTIKTYFSYENGDYTIKSSPQKNKYEYILENEYKLFFEFKHSCQMANSLTSEVNISQKVLLKLSSEKAKPLRDFINMSYKLINFFAFAANRELSIKNIYVSSKNIIKRIGEKDYPIEVEVIYKSVNKANEEFSYDPRNMLFTFNDIEQTFEPKIQTWLQKYQIIEPTMNLYFSVKRNNHTYVESEFLFLIQALETYHRRTSYEKFIDEEEYEILISTVMQCCPDNKKEWLEGKLKFSNEISLRTRIKRIMRPFNDLIGTSQERKNLIRKIVDTRNYLTHYNLDLKDKALSGLELIELNKKLEGLLELSFLKELKFSKEEIDLIFKKIIMKKFKNG